MVELNFDRLRPPALIDLERVDELRGWRRDGGRLVLGAGLTYGALMRSEVAADRCPPSPRRRAPSARPRSGTAARSGATSARRLRPATRFHPSCVEGAEVQLVSAARRACRFPSPSSSLGPKRSALAADELIASVAVSPGGGSQTFMKVGATERDGDRCLLARALGRPRTAARSAPPTAAPAPSSGLVTGSLDDADGFPDAGRRGLLADRRRPRHGGLPPARAPRPHAARAGEVSRMSIASASGQRRAASSATSAAARACSSPCASGSGSPARRTRASRASAARARCCSTASSSVRASSSRPRPTGVA